MPPGVWSVRDRRLFTQLRRSPTRARCGPVTVSRVLPSPPPDRPQVAFAVGRQVGGAVTRNRLRRVLRDEAARLHLAPGAYLVRVGPAGAASTAAELRTAFRSAVQSLPEGGS